MPVRDRYHPHVRKALEKDGWTITHDPFRLAIGAKDLYVDIGAERIIAAEKGADRIAVEVKTFGGVSEIDDLEKAVGQYILYHDVLAKIDPGRILFLAIPESVFQDLFQEPVGQLLLENRRVTLLVFDPVSEEIRLWTN